jgi:4-amino-4-deoxy-L-arabinose transferase-like glycosyltransferase
MPRLSRNHTTWIVILAVALVARLAAGALWQARLEVGRQFYFGDSDSYWELARTIARGDDYQYRSPDARVFRAPGYPLILAGLFVAFGDEPPVMAGRAISAVLGTVAVGVVLWWATHLFDARAGLVAGWIAALYPGGVALGAFVLSEAPFCPLMLAHLALWGMAARAATTGRATAWAAAGGIAAAGATLMRPSWLLFTPFAILAGLAFVGDRRRHLVVGAFVCAGLVAVMMPWWIRNAQLTGHFVPTTLVVGASLYDGLHEGATGASDMRFMAEAAARERAQPAGGEELFEYRLDRRLAREALDWTRANPGRAVELAWIKFWRMWNVWPNEPAFRGWAARLAMLVTYVPLLILGVVGAWRFTRWGWPYALAWLPAVYLTLLHVVFVGSIRYREPAMLALAVLAAGVLAGATRSENAGGNWTEHPAT